MPVYLTRPPSGPVARIFATVIAGAALVGAFMLGLVFLAVVLAVATVLGIAAWVRVWWLGRKQPSPKQAPPFDASDQGAIEAEFTVVSREKTDP